MKKKIFENFSIIFYKIFNFIDIFVLPTKIGIFFLDFILVFIFY